MAVDHDAYTQEADPKKLAELRDKVAEARDLEQVVADLEDRMKGAKKALNDLLFTELPSLFDECGVDEIKLSATGNAPAVVATAKPYYRANIAATWDDDRRAAAFDWLMTHGHADLIKQEVSLAFARGEADQTAECVHMLEAAGFSPNVKQAVPHTTLTAWLRDQVERAGTLPPLETLGATVGRAVTLKSKD